MLKERTNVLYCEEYKKLQTHTTFEQLKQTVLFIEKKYKLTKSKKAVLNTLKLHSKNFVGVCWMKYETIAKKCGYSVTSVRRAIQDFVETGVIRVYGNFHTVKGGDSANTYVINNLTVSVDNSNLTVSVDNFEQANEHPFEHANEQANEHASQPSNPCGSKDCDSPYKNTHSNSNKNPDKKPNTEEIKDFDNIDNTLLAESDIEEVNQHILRHVPKEFVEIMNPYYGNNPHIILARWKSTCIAAKNWCNSIHNASWETIRSAWKDSVMMYKTGQLRNNTEDGIAGFYYTHLSGKLVDDYARMQE